MQRTRAITVSRPRVIQVSAPRRRALVSRVIRTTRRRKSKMTIPLALIAGFLPAVMDVMNNAGQVGYLKSAIHTAAGLLGYDTVTHKYRGWSQASAAGAGGIIAGVAVHILASKTGVNRRIAATRIPLLRI